MAFLANPTARFTHYVDGVNGTSAGPGSAAAPWATIDQAIAAVPTAATAVGGQTGTIRLVGTAASPQTYVSTAGLTIGGTLTIAAVEPLGAKVAGNGTSRAILLAAGANLTLQDVIIDPSLNNGGAAAIGVEVPSTAAVISLTCTRVLFQNFTDRAISMPSGSRLNLTWTDSVINGGNVNGGIYLNNYFAGALVVSGGSITLTGQKLSSTGGGIVALGTTGTTATFNVTDCDTSITLDATLVGSGLHCGIRALNIPGAVVDGGTHFIGGTTAARTGACTYIDYSGALNCSDSVIRNATGVNATNGGYVFAIGLEASGNVTQAQDCGIIDNTASASGAAIPGGCHLAFMGFTKNGTISGNTLNDGGISIVDKNNEGCTVTTNVITGFNSSALRPKGSTGSTYTGNTVTQTGAYSGVTCMLASWDDGSTNVTSGLTCSGNTFANAGGSGTIMVQLDNDGSSANTPTNNVYNQSSGSLSANAWRWLGVNYGTLSAWRAGVEPTATGNAP